MGGLVRSLSGALAFAAMPLVPCHIEGFSEEVLCGTHRVFEDRAARTGRTIDLKVAVVPALRREGAPDPLFLLAGGPGQGATKYGPLIPTAFKEVRKTRDVVLVDLRGTGGSNPLGCDLGDPLTFLKEGDIDASSCLRELKGDPRFYTTEPAVDDLDEVRAALGYERINLWGGSYGTRAALVYARRHPDRVRTVVLDGAAPFEIALPLYNAWGAQRAMDRLLADCAAEPECRTAYPRLREELAEVFARLDQGPVRTSLHHPRSGKPVEISITRGGFASGLRGMLYTPAHASLIPWVVHSARQGDFAPFATLTLETASWSTETMSLGMTLSVLCSEDVHRIRDEEAEREVRGTFAGTFEIDAWRRMCEDWPRGPVPALDRRLLRVPALILSGDLDPVTPPRWGEAMKKHFPGALHVVVPGTAHNTSTTGCVPDLIARFVDQGGAGGIDPSCVRKVRRPPFVIDPSGTAP
ncbi:MAG TPA: alpha/beta hydrolase [Thermoanaerobaculia bacterium]|nr:alpha/beta hydrolase [Thermoanaerobaculia bacterium]